MLYLDCESAGLRGDIFAAALVGDTEILFDGFYRHPALQTNSWLRENVEPNLTGKEYKTLQLFQAAFVETWNKQKDKACVCHMDAPVESNFFHQLFDACKISEFDGMYPMLDTAPLLAKAGFDPTSELAFLNEKGIELPEGKPHSALFDAQVTRLVWNQF
jgi:hypothetical protein